MLKIMIRNTTKLRRMPLMALALLGMSLSTSQVAMAQWTYENQEAQDYSQAEPSDNAQGLEKLKLVGVNNSTVRISYEPGIQKDVLCESISNADAEALGDQQKAIGIIWLKVRVINGNCHDKEGWVSMNNTKLPS